MNTDIHSNHFPLTKGTMLFAAVVLTFMLLAFIVYLYYDLRLEQIQQTLQQLSNS